MEIFKETFFIYASISGILIAGLCSFVGVYVILKRVVFIGLALSEIAALGVALGFLLGFRSEIAALFLVFGSIIFFWKQGKEEKQLSNESVIGAIYVISGALGLILISKNPRVEASGFDLVKGNILYTMTSDLWFLGVLAVVIVVTHILLYKEFLFVSFDRETAHTVGLNTSLYEFILYLSIGIVVAVSMRVGGILFVFGSMVVPPLISLTLFKKVNLIFVFSIIVATISVIIGLILSYFVDLPTTPTILCIYGLVFLLANISKKII